MQIEWQENETNTMAEAKSGELELRLSQYTDESYCKGQWHWQVWVSDTRAVVSGIADTREKAVEMVSSWVEQGVAVIHSEAAKKLRAEIDERIFRLQRIDKAADEWRPGFGIGYRAGLVDAQAALSSLLEA